MMVAVKHSGSQGYVASLQADSNLLCVELQYRCWTVELLGFCLSAVYCIYSTLPYPRDRQEPFLIRVSKVGCKITV